jgi:hypothetical protein
MMIINIDRYLFIYQPCMCTWLWDKDKREEPRSFVEVLTELMVSEKNKGFTWAGEDKFKAMINEIISWINHSIYNDQKNEPMSVFICNQY